MQIFRIENKAKKKLTIILEPWAEEFYLKEGQILELQQPEDLTGYYHQTNYEDGDIQIFVEGNFDYPVVLIDSKPAEPFLE